MLYVGFTYGIEGGRSVEKDIDDLIFGSSETIHSER